jgi:hypothetical protein
MISIVLAVSSQIPVVSIANEHGMKLIFVRYLKSSNLEPINTFRDTINIKVTVTKMVISGQGLNMAVIISSSRTIRYSKAITGIPPT